MKRLLVTFILISIIIPFSMPSFIQKAQGEVVYADIKDKEVLKLKTSKTKYLDEKNYKVDPERAKLVLKLQKEKDVEDLESLWKATVDRNSAIRFALEKLATPQQERHLHSSAMAKTVSTLINGASLVPFMAGANYSLQTASVATGQIANRLITNRKLPKTSPLTDTELIQLSELVEGLQNELVKSYYDYKSSISSLKACREKLELEHKNYKIALNNNNKFSMIVAGAIYDDQRLEEIQLKEQIKLNRLKLERLAGHDAVEALNLSRISYNKMSNQNET